MLEEYFEDTVYPMSIKKYQTKTYGNGASTEDGGPFIISLMNGIHCKALTRGKYRAQLGPLIYPLQLPFHDFYFYKTTSK